MDNKDRLELYLDRQASILSRWAQFGRNRFEKELTTDGLTLIIEGCQQELSDEFYKRILTGTVENKISDSLDSEDTPLESLPYLRSLYDIIHGAMSLEPQQLSDIELKMYETTTSPVQILFRACDATLYQIEIRRFTEEVEIGYKVNHTEYPKLHLGVADAVAVEADLIKLVAHLTNCRKYTSPNFLFDVRKQKSLKDIISALLIMPQSIVRVRGINFKEPVLGMNGSALFRLTVDKVYDILIETFEAEGSIFIECRINGIPQCSTKVNSANKAECTALLSALHSYLGSCPVY